MIQSGTATTDNSSPETPSSEAPSSEASSGTAASVQPTSARAVLCADRPVMLAGLKAALGGEGDVGLDAACGVADLVSAVEEHDPDLIVIALREQEPDPFQALATAHALSDDLRILAIMDSATVVDLREAIVAGVDSVLLSSAPLEEIRDAVTATVAGERITSPEIAMQLAGPWRGDDEDMVAGLTPRELEVLQVIAEGRTNKEVARELDLSARTVKTHVQNLLQKLEAPDRTGAVATGFRLGLIR